MPAALRKASLCARFVRAAFAVAALGLSAQAQSLAPAAAPVDFGSSPLGTPAANQSIQFTVPAGSTATVTGTSALTEGAAGEDFSVVSSTCTGTLVGPANCTVTAGFTPQQRGLRRGALVITQAGGSQPLVVFLRGTGIGSQLVFSPDTVSVTATVAPLIPSLFSPTAVVFDGNGDTIFNDILNARVLEQTTAGTLSQLASLAGTLSQSAAIDGAGRIYVTVPQMGTVVRIDAPGSVTTLSFAGVTMATPSGVAVDGNGNLYVADAGANRIVRANADGSNATVLPLTGLATGLSQPHGLTTDGTSLYIVDSINARVVRVTLASGAATALAITGAQPYNPYGISIDASGSLYIADTGNRRILRVLPTLASTAIVTPSYTFSSPVDVEVATNGDLMVADSNNGLVRVVRATPSSTLVFSTSTPEGSLDSADGVKSVTLQNIGNTALQLSVPAGSAQNPSTTNPSFAVSAASTCPVVQSTSPVTFGQLAPAASCTYGVTFTPNALGPITGSLSIQSMPTGAAGSVTSNVPLMGTGAPPADTVSITATPNPTVVGTAVNLTVRFTLTGAAAVNYRGSVTLTTTDPGATFPSGTTYTFTAADAGVHTFSPGIVFSRAGTFRVTVSDGSLSAFVNVVVNAARLAPGVTLASSATSVFMTNPVTFTATVTGVAGGATPTGTVTFFNGGAALGAVAVDANGHAALTTSFAATGSYNITAAYSGDTLYTAATSAAVTETVADFTLAGKTGTANTASVLPGATAAYTFTVSPVGAATFPAPITLSVTGVPPGSTFALTPTAIAAGAGVTDVQLSVSIPTNFVAQAPAPGKSWERITPVVFGFLLLPFLTARARRRLRPLLLVGVLAVSAFGLSGCLGNTSNGYFGVSPHTYQPVVTATSGTLSHSVTVTLTVE